jgi:hypothetical protein
MPNSEIIFEVTEDIEGGYSARALGYSIFTQAAGSFDCHPFDKLRASSERSAAPHCHPERSGAESKGLGRNALEASPLRFPA